MGSGRMVKGQGYPFAENFYGRLRLTRMIYHTAEHSSIYSIGANMTVTGS